MDFWQSGFWATGFWSDGFWGDAVAPAPTFVLGTRRPQINRTRENDEALLMLVGML
jgi:hypothetical protein